MDPVTILALVDGFLTIVEKLVPAIQQGVQSGQITVAQQKDILSRLDAIRTGSALWSGPEWKVDPTTPVP